MMMTAFESVFLFPPRKNVVDDFCLSLLLLQTCPGGAFRLNLCNKV
jgi:hypothetical protein